MDLPYKHLSTSKTLDGQRLPTQFERKAAVMKQNNKEEKELLPFVTIPTLSVYYKRSFNEKVVQPTTLAKFYTTAYYFATNKENH